MLFCRQQPAHAFIPQLFAHFHTISEVIFQPGAFSCMLDGQWDEPVADSAYQAARDALAGSDPSGGAIYYFNPVTATNAWIWSRPEIITIGKHRFCA